MPASFGLPQKMLNRPADTDIGNSKEIKRRTAFLKLKYVQSFIFPPIFLRKERFFESGSLGSVKISLGLMIIHDFRYNVAILSHIFLWSGRANTTKIVPKLSTQSTPTVNKKLIKNFSDKIGGWKRQIIFRN